MTSQFNSQILDYIAQSPTPFHAVSNAISRLSEAGFVRLFETDKWQLSPGHKYFVTRRDSSIIAFHYGTRALAETGVRILGAHTDSPCLKVKPEPDVKKLGYHQVATEVYGGVLLSTWFDRDLSLAGRVSVLNDLQKLEHYLVDFKRPIAIIPSLAIHLDRNVNNERSINPQEQMLPIVWQSALTSGDDLRACLRDYLIAQGNNVSEVLDFNLSLYDVQSGTQLGIGNEFLASSRLDNLLSCFVVLQSLLESSGDITSIVVLNDHEEVGSQSTAGAASNFLTGMLERLLPDVELRHRVESRSMMLSVDNAHGVHPNFAAKHDGAHAPRLNGGPVLKFDANQSYATQSTMAAQIRTLAHSLGIRLQSYVTRADMRCGSTIGPITAAATGIETLDIGVPTLGMHSIRELAGVTDSIDLHHLLVAFFNQ
jgi:aspartyl aminopeptidase